MAQITCKNVSLGYEGTTITENINFTVNSGDYLCIVGENGSGKSTLIKALLKLKAPISGEITTDDGVDSAQIGYLPQQTLVQRDFPASVREVVMSGFAGKCGFRPFYSLTEKALAKQNMQKLDVYDIRHKCYRDLSGGQQQRVLLARALCATKSILLLDEPVAGLDPVVTNEMYELINKINKDGITVIMVSHDINASIEYASHILHLGNEPLFYGTKEDYINSAIGSEYIKAMGGNK